VFYGVESVEIPEGFCQCGCGGKTKPFHKDFKDRGILKGTPRRFLHGHNCPAWAGGRMVRKQGYVVLKLHDHPRATPNGYVYEHIVLAEKALGKPLPPKAEIHHHGPKIEQRLVICEDRSYHTLIENRTKALKACGNANWLKCYKCKQYDAPENIVVTKSNKYHRACVSKKQQVHQQ